MKRWLTFVVALGLLAAGLGLWAASRWTNRPLSVAAAGKVFTVEAGEPFVRVSQRLASEGIVDHPRWLAWYATLRGDAARVQAGEYQIEAGTTPGGLLEQLVEGRVLMHTVTLVEGWTFAQARAAIQSDPSVQVELGDLDDTSVMDRLGKPGVHPEGRLMPDTYRFARGTTDSRLLSLALEKLDAALAEAWASRAPGLPLATPEEALILASLVEKETGAADERPRVAGVFVNRLRMGMRLQTDPSVIYGLGAGFDGNLRKADLLRDGPYNTYRRGGLPPTPIALVGREALQAAVQPADTDAVYFVATGLGDGRHYFAATLPEHNRNVARFLAAQRGADDQESR
ncbi:MAG: endolytic transglycosylase MltG [Gammaproteobacteria bacterium]|nr:endolytic transglycosylase MltG [Gammaproteobacteria bacterium]